MAPAPVSPIGARETLTILVTSVSQKARPFPGACVAMHSEEWQVRHLRQRRSSSPRSVPGSSVSSRASTLG